MRMLLLPLLITLTLPQAAASDHRDFHGAHRDADAALLRGAWGQAIAGFERCRELGPTRPAVTYGLACSHARAGNTRLALYWLERAADLGYADLAVAQWDGDLASLRQKPRFAQVLEQMRETQGERKPSQRLLRIPADAGYPDVEVAITADGRRIACGNSSGIITIIDPLSAQEIGRFPALRAGIAALAFSPDGNWIVAIGEDQAYGVFSVVDGAARFRSTEFRSKQGRPCLPHAHVEFSPTGECFFVASDSFGGLFRSEDGSPLNLARRRFGRRRAAEFDWSTDGLSLALVDRSEARKGVVFLNSSTGAIQRELAISPPLRSLAYSPDGKHMALGTESGGVQIVAVNNGQTVNTLKLQDMVLGSPPVLTLEFSPSGQQLTYSSGLAAHMLVADVFSGKLQYNSGWLAGASYWGSNILFAPSGGQIWGQVSTLLTFVDLETEAEAHFPLGNLPKCSNTDLAVVAIPGGFACLNPNTAQFYWARMEQGDGTYLLQAPAGYLGGSAILPEGFNQYDWGRKATIRVEYEQRAIYDPKRVRAGIAGVPLLPLGN